MLPGGATVPGRALIDTLPLVWQIVLKSVLWHVGRASATGAVNIVSADTPAMNSADLRRAVIASSSHPPARFIGIGAVILMGDPAVVLQRRGPDDGAPRVSR